jgi:protein-L-isoaspartate(D-aspartate) O-methyltransferase
MTAEPSNLTRHAMIALIKARGIHDPRVIAAMASVPRDQFVAPALVREAYGDRPLPIEHGQTISQPYIVALMANALELDGDDRVLEIGTGSGYGAAVLSRIAGDVDTIERIPELARAARARLAAFGCANVTVHDGDGSLGWPAHAPYDAIVVTAASPAIPPALLEQLAIGGRLVIPIGNDDDQELVRIIRTEHDYISEHLCPVRFVPLIGEQAWASA